MAPPEPGAPAAGGFAELDQAAQDAVAAGDLASADRCWTQALAHDPTQVAALRNHGAVLRRLGRPGEALARYGQALTLDPGYAAARIARANLLNQLQRWPAAIADAQAAITVDPAQPGAHNALGCALAGAGRASQAAAAFARAVDLDPTYADPRVNLGNLALDRAQPQEALQHYRGAAEVQPQSVEAWMGQGHAASLLGRWADAAQAYDRAAALDDAAPGLLGYRRNARMKLCDWTGFAADVERIGRRLAEGRPASPPFPLLAICPDPQLQLAAARLAAAGLPAPVAAAPPPPSPRLRVAYLSSDFHAHATAWLIAEMLERHDRDAFEIIGVSFGPATDDPVRARLVAACERFFDVRSLDDAAVVDLVRGLGADIAVDLKGYTTGARPGLFARGLAPVQISYLGYPGTMGGAGLGYIIADPIVIPPGAEAAYSETVLRLGCYQPNDRQRPRPPRRTRRADHGLPDEGFVFGAFNNPYKITPDVFAVWMELLAATPDGVLWTFAGTPEAADNLRAAAARAGVDPGRLVFAAPLPLEAHLERHHHVGVMLDTSPYTAHTTASDALWMGVPLVTVAGAAFAARVAASLVTAAGVPDLAVGSWGEYRALALSLAHDPDRLADVRRRLDDARPTCRLFDTETHVRELEALYRSLRA